MNVASLFSEDRKPNSKTIWNILGPPHNRYLEILPHAIFYAPKRTYEGLGQTTRITGAIHDSFSKNLEAIEIANRLNKISRLLIMANSILANEMRTQLGLGKIKQPAWAKKLQGQVDT